MTHRPRGGKGVRHNLLTEQQQQNPCMAALFIHFPTEGQLTDSQSGGQGVMNKVAINIHVQALG